MDMEKDELIGDEFLRNLIQKSSLDSPGDDFVMRVMGNISKSPELVPVHKSFWAYTKSAFPYIGLAAFILLVFFTSDFPFLNWLPGNEFFAKYFLVYFSSSFGFFKDLLASKFASMGVIIFLSVCFLGLLEYLFHRKANVQHHLMS